MPAVLQRTKWLVVAATAAAIPMTLALESTLRRLFMSEDFDEMRAWLRPEMTAVAWGAAVLGGALGIWGLLAFERFSARAILRLPEDRRTPEQLAGARIGAFVLVASLTQLPGLISMLALMLGAAWLPVVVGAVISTGLVLAQGLRC